MAFSEYLNFNKSKLESNWEKTNTLSSKMDGQVRTHVKMSSQAMSNGAFIFDFFFSYFKKRKGRFPKQASNWHFLAFPAKYSIALIFFPLQTHFYSLWLFSRLQFWNIVKNRNVLFIGAYKDVLMFFFIHAKKFHDPCTDKLAKGQKTVQSDWSIFTYVLGSNYQFLTWVIKDNFHLIAKRKHNMKINFLS